MSKLSNPNARNVGAIDDSDGRRNFGSAGKVHRYESGANTRGMSQRSPSAPAPGERSGVSRSDSYKGRATGTKRDL
jgi:hypothetical protein